MKLQVTESQLKLIEQQQLNELKWLANVQSHIVRMDIPLTPSLVNYIWGKQRVTTFHVGDVNGIDDIDALDTDELASIKNATDAYNDTISAVASANENVALVDLNSNQSPHL